MCVFSAPCSVLFCAWLFVRLFFMLGVCSLLLPAFWWIKMNTKLVWAQWLIPQMNPNPQTCSTRNWRYKKFQTSYTRKDNKCITNLLWTSESDSMLQRKSTDSGHALWTLVSETNIRPIVYFHLLDTFDHYIMIKYFIIHSQRGIFFERRANCWQS